MAKTRGQHTRSRSNTPQSQLSLDVFERQSILHSLNHNQISIVQHLLAGYYPAMISRKVRLSRSYISRFIHKLLDAKLITPGYKDPLYRRAITYLVSKELSTYISNLERPKGEDALTLVTPHNLRYKYELTNKTDKPIAIDMGRFAHSKWKYNRTYSPRGGDRYVFSTEGLHGEYKIIVHPHSLEVLCSSRKYIPARSIAEATNLLSMSLNEAAQRFCDEQHWCNVSLSLGEPKLVGSIHYAFKSKDLKKIVTQSGTMKKIGEFELDKSPEAEGNTVEVELETINKSEAERFDECLRKVPKVHDELRSVQEAILGMNDMAAQMTAVHNNVQALTQSGLPLQNLYNQLVYVVSQQGHSITMMQNTMLKVVDNMGKILERMEAK